MREKREYWKKLLAYVLVAAMVCSVSGIDTRIVSAAEGDGKSAAAFQDTWTVKETAAAASADGAVIKANADGSLNMKTGAKTSNNNNAAFVVNEKLKAVTGGSISLKIRQNSDTGKTGFGVIFRYKDGNNFGMVGYDAFGWYVKARSSKSGQNLGGFIKIEKEGVQIAGPNAGEEVTLDIDASKADGTMAVSINGEEVFQGALPSKAGLNYNDLDAGYAGFIIEKLPTPAGSFTDVDLLEFSYLDPEGNPIEGDTTDPINPNPPEDNTDFLSATDIPLQDAMVNADSWEAGKGNYETQNVSFLKISPNDSHDNAGNRFSVTSKESGDVVNGTMNATFQVTKENPVKDIKFGIQIRHKSQAQLTWLAYDQNGWYIQRKDKGLNVASERRNPDLMVKQGEDLKVSVTFNKNVYSVTVNGVKVFDNYIFEKDNIAPIAGPVGFMESGGQGDIYIKDISYSNSDNGSSAVLNVDSSAWSTPNGGTVKTEVKKGNPTFTLAGPDSAQNEEAGEIKDGVVETVVVPANDNAEFGLVFRYVDDNNNAYFGYDNAYGWFIKETINGTDIITKINGISAVPEKDKKIRLAAEFSDKKAIVTVNNQIKADTIELKTGSVKGFSALLVQAGSTVKATEYKYGKLDVESQGEANPGIPAEIKSDRMTVQLDKNFPRVYKYTLDNQEVPGQPLPISACSINEYSKTDALIVTPAVTYTQVSADTAEYSLHIDENGLTADIKMQYKVEDNILSFEITEMKVTNGKIETISIPNMSMVSVRNNEPGSGFDGAVMSNNVSVLGDKHIDVNSYFSNSSPDFKQDKKSDLGYMYGFVSNDRYSAGVWSNSEADNDKRIRRSAQASNEANEEPFTYIGIGSSEWYYEYQGGKNPEKTHPAAKVVIQTKDQNGDNVMNWQDSAIDFRRIMNNPFKSEEVPDLVGQRVIENFASQASHPFLETLDGIKRVNLVTDGLGQQILLKGFANEGHDSAHPDYGDVGQRIGGVEDFRTLLEQSKQYGAKVGVHINASEGYPEAKAFNEELFNVNTFAWNWLDEGYPLNHMIDLTSGARAKRLDQLKVAVDGSTEPQYDKDGNLTSKLDFIYLDVWGSPSWPTRRISEQFNERGWRCGNEWSYANEYDGTWNHWAADLSYGGADEKGINSEIARFLRNHQKDSWQGNYTHGGTMDHPLLGGMDVVGFEGWQRENNFEEYIDTTFKTNIPTKFLQHYLVTRWETDPTIDTAKSNAEKMIELQSSTDGILPNGKDTVVVERKTEGRGRTIKFNGTLVLNEENDNDISYLLPWKWDENGEENTQKLYHWNEKGGETTWELPSGWNVSNVKAYVLTDTGKKDEVTLNVVNNQITINAKAKTPYVVYPGTAAVKIPTFAEMQWGYGTHLIDPNFSSMSLEAWNVNGDKDAVSIVRTDGANPVLKIENPAKITSVKQTLTDLAGGETYSAIVSVENKGDNNAYLTISTGDGKTKETYTQKSVVQNYIGVNSHRTGGSEPSYYQNMSVDFTVPKGETTAVLELRTGSGTGIVCFDEIRIAKTKAENWNEDGSFTQDFENVVQGIYPFVVGNYKGRPSDVQVHLSEMNAPYTQKGWNNRIIDDVITSKGGKWSLKAHQLVRASGIAYQTIPQNYRFEPGKKYTVTFDYESGSEGSYGVVIGDGEHVRTVGLDNLTPENGILFNEKLPKATEPTEYKLEITGSETGNTWFGIYSYTEAPDAPADKKETAVAWKMNGADIILDNLAITCDSESTISEEFKALQQLIEKVKAVYQTGSAAYTQETWEVFENAYIAAKARLSAANAAAKDLQETAEELEAAYAGLVKNPDDNNGGNSDNNSGSNSNDNSSDNTITPEVPAENVEILVTLVPDKSGNVAVKVADKQITDAILKDGSQKNPTKVVEINVKTAGANKDKIGNVKLNLSGKSMKALSDAGYSIQLNHDWVNAVFDQKAIKEIYSKSKNSTIAFNAVLQKSLPEIAKKVTAGRPAYHFTISYRSNNKTVFIPNYETGKIKISIPYTLKKGEPEKDTYIVKMTKDGNLIPITSKYNEKTIMVEFTTDKLGTYAVMNSKVKETIYAKPAATKQKTYSVGKTVKAPVTHVQKSAKVTYTASNKDVFVVSKDGRITLKKPGKAVLSTTVKQNGKTYLLKTTIIVKK